MQASLDIDQAIRVVVAPSQASYFAGEPFVVTITISNLRTPQASITPRSVSNSPYTHKRGAHSVSYVPMARPPTSPGVRTTLPAPSVRQSEETGTPTRRGVIGRGHPPQGAQVLPQPEQLKKRPVPNKSLSVSIAVHELRDEVLQDPKGKSPARTLSAQTSLYASPTSPVVSSPLTRNSTVPVNHPHARKHSVLLDGEVQVQDVRPSVVLPTPNPSTSAFSLSLDPITENNSSPILPATPAISSPITNGNLPGFRVDTVTSSTSAESVLNRIAAATTPRKPPLLGLSNGHPKGPSIRKSISSSFSAPNSELILYSYAQLAGSLSLVSLSDASPTPDQVRTLQTLRRTLANTKGIGGGSMDIASHTPQSLPYGHQMSSTRRPSHSRSSSLTVGLFSLLSPSALLPPSPTLPSSHSRSQSLFSTLFGPSPSSSSAGLGIGLNDDPEPDPVDPEAPLPTFEVQPKMVAVDLALGPGESRCYTYSLELPRNLPPTYRGRCLRFSYEFVLGVCRALPRPTSGSSSSSRVLKVPIRVYNHVVVDRSPSPYDLLWPVQRRGQPVDVALTETPSNARQQALNTATGGVQSTSESVRAYAKSLLATTGANVATNWPDQDHNRLMGLGVEEAEADPSCREAVEILTRNPKKLSYDVNKDGVKVAVLTFTKSAYRLGETVMGVIELNRRAGRSRVLKLSALLEAHESLPDNIAPAEPATSRHLRRVHAEQHSSFIANTLRTTFSLDIPPDASPAFQIDVGPPSAPKSSPGGLEWKVRLCLFVAVASAGAREGVDGVRLKHLVRAGQPGAWGTSWKGAKTIAPSERPTALPGGLGGAGSQQSWTSFLTGTLLGNSETSVRFHDGDEEDEGSEVDETETEVGAEEDWREVGVEMVECVVPIKVWPGNTAFKAAEVVLEV